jgi:hypothetical protein
MIPGAREPGMLTTFGVQVKLTPQGPSTMDAATIAMHQTAGGGGPDQRRRARAQSRWNVLARKVGDLLTGSRQT